MGMMVTAVVGYTGICGKPQHCMFVLYLAAGDDVEAEESRCSMLWRVQSKPAEAGQVNCNRGTSCISY